MKLRMPLAPNYFLAFSPPSPPHTPLNAHTYSHIDLPASLTCGVADGAPAHGASLSGANEPYISERVTIEAGFCVRCTCSRPARGQGRGDGQSPPPQKAACTIRSASYTERGRRGREVCEGKQSQCQNGPCLRQGGEGGAYDAGIRHACRQAGSHRLELALREAGPVLTSCRVRGRE